MKTCEWNRCKAEIDSKERFCTKHKKWMLARMKSDGYLQACSMMPRRIDPDRKITGDGDADANGGWSQVARAYEDNG